MDIFDIEHYDDYIDKVELSQISENSFRAFAPYVVFDAMFKEVNKALKAEGHQQVSQQEFINDLSKNFAEVIMDEIAEEEDDESIYEKMCVIIGGPTKTGVEFFYRFISLEEYNDIDDNIINVEDEKPATGVAVYFGCYDNCIRFYQHFSSILNNVYLFLDQGEYGLFVTDEAERLGEIMHECHEFGGQTKKTSLAYLKEHNKVLGDKCFLDAIV